VVRGHDRTTQHGPRSTSGGLIMTPQSAANTSFLIDSSPCYRPTSAHLLELQLFSRSRTSHILDVARETPDQCPAKAESSRLAWLSWIQIAPDGPHQAQPSRRCAVNDFVDRQLVAA
jgi:hypothetical protein